MKKQKLKPAVRNRLKAKLKILMEQLEKEEGLLARAKERNIPWGTLHVRVENTKREIENTKFYLEGN